MKYFLSSLIILSSLLPAAAQPTKETAAQNNRFAFDLYGRLDKDQKNIFFSPYSISSALAMAYAGARTQTATEMEQVMYFKGGQAVFHKNFSKLMQEIRSRNNTDVQMNVANRLFGAKSYRFSQDFTTGLQRDYQAPLETMDFLEHTDASRQHINKWVELQTKDRIKDLIPEGSLSPETKLVLVNAVYFYADWLFQFDSANTRKEIFYMNGLDPIKHDMMQQLMHFEYMETPDMQAVRLPYKGGNMSMEIILPRKRTGLPKLEATLSYEQYEKWTAAFKMQKLQLSLPKFKITRDLNLGEMLQSMGMATAFSPQADFSGMTGKKDLLIDKVIHKAFVEVSEKGTEAAAATAILMTPTSIREPYEEPYKIFRADQPFLFIIRDNATGSILFMGRIDNPKQ